MRIYDNHRAKAGVMRLTEYLRRCVLGEQSMIKRKVILIGVEVCDRFRTERLNCFDQSVCSRAVNTLSAE
jgi:hypothetical protein